MKIDFTIREILVKHLASSPSGAMLFAYIVRPQSKLLQILALPITCRSKTKNDNLEDLASELSVVLFCYKNYETGARVGRQQERRFRIDSALSVR